MQDNSEMQKWLCDNGLCSICAQHSCPDKKDILKSEKIRSLDILICCKEAEIDIELDKPRKNKKKIKKLMQELSYLKEVLERQLYQETGPNYTQNKHRNK